MGQARGGQVGLALGAWGAVQASAAGGAIAVSGFIRDGVSRWPARGAARAGAGRSRRPATASSIPSRSCCCSPRWSRSARWSAPPAPAGSSGRRPVARRRIAVLVTPTARFAMPAGAHHRLCRRSPDHALRVLDLLRRPDLLPAPRGQARGLSRSIPTAPDSVRVQGFPPMPRPEGVPPARTAAGATAPRPSRSDDDRRASRGAWLGAPMEPTGTPMLDGVGPASYAQRPDVAGHRRSRCRPQASGRCASPPSSRWPSSDPDPRGMDGGRRRPHGRRHRGRCLGRSVGDS